MLFAVLATRALAVPPVRSSVQLAVESAKRRHRIRLRMMARHGGKCGRRRGAGEVGGDALDLLVGLVCRVARDELILLELDDDVGPRSRGADVQAARGDELDMDLAL